ncbi:Bicoid-interacting protein 3-domain-containing protein [Crepidotus variabilis]|uniref:RNA methyltransferase n=1 Tax=Crepidotus variabilis TaxID=179855 RepID=A0A9P6JJU6_9AGAR|nr:Bicoid-interacting protein 3-domain-containing protein [Crepidotus variabilis]
MPNVPTHGNYVGYYTKRPFLNDERLSFLPADLFKGKRVLDVGCNEGFVTCEIAQCHDASYTVGVDIDNSLIQAAWRRRRVVWSLQEPTLPVESNANHDDEPIVRARPSYFPASCEHEFGSLPVPPSQNRGKTNFPHNMGFRHANWVNEHIPEDKDGYDVVLGFSISKWIHLNDGDEGLEAFFRRVFGVLKSGGVFVLEPQPWDSYAKAKKMDQRLKENGNRLKHRPEDFGRILREMGFEDVEHIGDVGVGGFRRPLHLYTKP